ncbi:glycosyltransferase family 2 protein [Histophilus somni]|uniref:glycosyltransferase family 2 protein n=1 Tax=Histophilus somni TaxID=731 RepID=UPI00201F2216|nr:glycosyltransferase [Histophilus somni]
MMRLPISVTMLVKNAEKYLAKSLSSLKDFPEIIVLDNGSTDRSIEIAKQFTNVKIYHSPFIGFGPMKNLVATYASYDWILNIDSDEILQPQLIQEISQLNFDEPRKVYALLRINHYRGKPIKTCGWYPDFVKRLYNKKLVKFDDKRVHEALEIADDIQVVRLKHEFNHYSFDSSEMLINKMQHYTDLFAEQQKYRKKSSVLSAIAHGIVAFFKSYILKRGILSGGDGFIISFANASGSYYKYIKLMEANQSLTTALIITTYNRPDALEAVLVSVLAQSLLPNEVIIADDGSTEDTKELIQKYQAIFPIPLKHVWQPDTGFRLAESRNKALSLVESEYVITIDGDMVLHPQFISDHCKAAEKNVFVGGGRILLTKDKTTALLQSSEQYSPLKWYEKGLETRVEKRLMALHIPFLSEFIQRTKRVHYYKGIRGCNMAFFLSDALEINGFNNDFVGWGREDSEFVARFFNNGGKRKNIKFAAIAYHLWHPEEDREALPVNDELLKRAIEDKLVFCSNGLNQIKLD